MGTTTTLNNLLLISLHTFMLKDNIVGIAVRQSAACNLHVYSDRGDLMCIYVNVCNFENLVESGKSRELNLQ